MKKRNPYKTAQQEAMLQYFLEDKHNFLTVKDLLSSLQKLQIDIGQTRCTVFWSGRLWKDLSLKSSRLMDRERSIGVYPVRRLI